MKKYTIVIFKDNEIIVTPISIDYFDKEFEVLGTINLNNNKDSRQLEEKLYSLNLTYSKTSFKSIRCRSSKPAPKEHSHRVVLGMIGNI